MVIAYDSLWLENDSFPDNYLNLAHIRLYRQATSVDGTVSARISNPGKT